MGGSGDRPHTPYGPRIHHTRMGGYSRFSDAFPQRPGTLDEPNAGGYHIVEGSPRPSGLLHPRGEFENCLRPDELNVAPTTRE